MNDRAALGFNRGSDARLAGRLRQPPKSQDDEYKRNWLYGWDSVHRSWGIDAHWPFQALPAVDGKKED